MRKLLVIAALALLPVASQAQFSLGLRVGYAPATGDAVKDFPLKDQVKSQIPIQVDAMYNFTPELSAGLYGSYGFGQLSSDQSDQCDAANVDCSASVMRFGVQGAFTFAKLNPQFVPWLGAGIGYEISSFDDGTDSENTSGFEFLNLQLGGDYKVSEKFAVGPYFQVSFGQYSSFPNDAEPDKAMHQWLNFGLRGKFDL